MKNKCVRVVLLLLVVAMVFSLSSCSNRGNTKTVKKQFYADSPSDKYGFDTDTTIHGKPYTLKGEKYRVVKRSTAPPSELDAVSGNPSSFTPGKTFSIGNNDYVVQSVSSKPEKVSKTVAVENEDDVPQEIVRTYSDHDENLKTKLTYHLESVSSNSSKKWTETKGFEINLVGYGQKYYDIGTTKLSGKDTLKDIQKKQKDVLEAQGLNTDKNRISDVSWKGEPYTDSSGNKCRDIAVSVETAGAPMTAKYAATLYRFSVKYIPQGSEPNQYLMEGTATYQFAGNSSAGWIRIVLTAVLVAGIILLLLLGWYIWKEYRLVQSGVEIREIDGVRYTEDDF